MLSFSAAQWRIKYKHWPLRCCHLGMTLWHIVGVVGQKGIAQMHCLHYVSPAIHNTSHNISRARMSRYVRFTGHGSRLLHITARTIDCSRKAAWNKRLVSISNYVKLIYTFFVVAATYIHVVLLPVTLMQLHPFKSEQAPSHAFDHIFFHFAPLLIEFSFKVLLRGFYFLIFCDDLIALRLKQHTWGYTIVFAVRTIKVPCPPLARRKYTCCIVCAAMRFCSGPKG
jgi:hypothetical protein